jgi:hypothetical protein
VVTFKRFRPPWEPEPEPAAHTEPEVAVPPAPAVSALLDTLPPPILEHILSQLLHACDSPGAVRILEAHFAAVSRVSLVGPYRIVPYRSWSPRCASAALGMPLAARSSTLP